ncbi:hypothetical protein Tsp_03553 [Trichinella spiralis]|uniref:hypothetical protein n=1 Tax=Trichinella spiralis TaxID=6334 RepID=UPI0001EFB633|nr:hypothetical protein Tsp_03553 [Trichinella spiralis]
MSSNKQVQQTNTATADNIPKRSGAFGEWVGAGAPKLIAQKDKLRAQQTQTHTHKLQLSYTDSSTTNIQQHTTDEQSRDYRILTTAQQLPLFPVHFNRHVLRQQQQQLSVW